MVVATKRPGELTLRDRLSRLNYLEACKLLGPEGKRLIGEGGKVDIDLAEQVYLGDDLFRLSLGDAVVTVTPMASVRRSLHFNCTECRKACEHAGTAFSLILEEKTALGLAAVPVARSPIESLSEEDLIRTAIAERKERARSEKMTAAALDPATPWTNYTVTNPASGKCYRVALRGLEPGESYCSCPDFRKNTLGTCKHLIHVAEKVKRRFRAADLAKPYRRTKIVVHLRYGRDVELRMLLPRIHDLSVKRIVEPLLARPITDLHDLLQRLRKLEAAGREVAVYPDAEEYIQRRLFEDRIRSQVAEIRADPARHPLRKGLLKVELLPYQLDGVAFAAGAGRAILADDMGLGKTIQAVGVAELLAREAGIAKVLIVCPASLKAQWRSEIERFTERSCQLVLGSASERPRQYANGSFFTVCNYEQVLRDITDIETAPWDLIVLDEGQRIKNWEAKTSRVLKGLRSRFALVLSGTPIENRLDDLFSVVEFIDDRRLGPAFRFYNRHRLVDEKGKVLGYQNLGELRERLAPVLLRRTRAAVMRELPERTTEVIRITPTQEQLDLNNAAMRVVSSIIHKPYISEMDLLRLQKALLQARMAADSTFLVNKEPPGYSTKIEKLDDLFTGFAAEEARKVVLFSEWTTMLGLIEKLLAKHRLRFVRLDGSVPQRKRQEIVREFQREPACRFLIMTNAGATGLNLQAADTVVNVDLPWNPAVLEQRIGRVHRMGQRRRVQVYVLVTEGTIEENLLGTLAAKHQLAAAALDLDSEVEQVDLASGIEELRRRLEFLLGAKPEAPRDVSEENRAQEEARKLVRAEEVASAGGQLLASALAVVRAVLPGPGEGDEARKLAEFIGKRLEECVSQDEKGRPQLTIKFPDRAALEDLSRSLAALLGVAAAGGPARN